KVQIWAFCTRGQGTNPLANNLPDHPRRLDSGEADFQALEANAELFVIDAQEVQDRRLQVAHMDGVLHNVIAKGTGLAKVEARLDAAARKPVVKAARMVVAAIVGGGEP